MVFLSRWEIYGVPKGSEIDSWTIVLFVEKLLWNGVGLREDPSDLHIEHSAGPQPPEDAPS